MRVVDALVLVICLAGLAAGSLRWLRVAQREHYLAGSPTRFSWRWWSGAILDRALAVVGLGAVVGSAFFAPAAVISGLTALVAPLRLAVRGRTSRLTWTRRLVVLALVSAVIEAACLLLGAAGGGLAGADVTAAILALGAFLPVELALLLTRPFEELLARRFVREATVRLESVHPLVVAVTGSYGKTTVKGYVAHLVGADRTVLPSPKSFNNRAGLARTVNELLGPATEVLIAEMGTYGPGEIAALCGWLRPEISAITAIGPAHLERFGSLDVTLASKAEIAETARTVVLNVDDERLAGLASVLSTTGKKVVGASGSSEVADVAVVPGNGGLEMYVGGHRIGLAAVGAAERPTAPTNVAVAAALALELGVRPEVVLARLASLPLPANRLQRYVAEGGYVVLDDTFNSNPAGARLALSRLRDEPAVAATGCRVVVTPGMVELGTSQFDENAKFGEAAARLADRLVVVSRTNKAAILTGARRAGAPAAIVCVDRLDEALIWVRANLGPGDAVLYENDLPDHFP